MAADMSVEPFDTFPKQFHVRWKTQVALIACGIGHAHVKVVKIKVSSVKPEHPGGYQCQDGMLSHCG